MPNRIFAMQSIGASFPYHNTWYSYHQSAQVIHIRCRQQWKKKRRNFHGLLAFVPATMMRITMTRTTRTTRTTTTTTTMMAITTIRWYHICWFISSMFAIHQCIGCRSAKALLEGESFDIPNIHKTTTKMQTQCEKYTRVLNGLRENGKKEFCCAWLRSKPKINFISYSDWMAVKQGNALCEWALPGNVCGCEWVVWVDSSFVETNASGGMSSRWAVISHWAMWPVEGGEWGGCEGPWNALIAEF